MLGRLVGQETEYAIRFTPERRHPGNDVVYAAIAGAIRALVRTAPGVSSGRSQRVFTENGGAFYYEFFPYCSSGGTLEGATPECRGPAQLLLYQRAQEALLRGALPAAQDRLRAMGCPGKIGLLKNCRDARGNVYGAQESYEVPLADGLRLFLYRLGIVSLVPVLILTTLVGWILFVSLVVVLLGIGLGVALSTAALGRARWLSSRFLSPDDRTLYDAIGRGSYWLLYVLGWPFFTGMSMLVSFGAFRRARRRATAFLVSRCVISGTGSFEPDGRFVLSEKAAAVNALVRDSIRPSHHPVFETGHLLKPAVEVAHGDVTALHSMFRRTQRLQLGLADSNLLDEAEFLKIGATALVIDMVEDGCLDDAPVLRRPIEALHAISADPTLEARVETPGGGGVTGLEIQRFYLERAKTYLASRTTTSLEARAVVDLWEEVLSLLEKRELDRLVGRLDWVTKRYLLEGCGRGEDARFLKTIDLRYHELGEGYAARLEKEGMVRRLTSPSEVERAVVEPPADTPAFTRGRFIRGHDPALGPLQIAWDCALIGGRLRGKIVRFPGAGAAH